MRKVFRVGAKKAQFETVCVGLGTAGQVSKVSDADVNAIHGTSADQRLSRHDTDTEWSIDTEWS